MSRQIAYACGLLAGFRYEFSRAGDSIPEHRHDAAHAHNIIVLEGAVELVIDGTARVLTAASVTDFDGSRPHLIRAVTPSATILNLYTHGAPDDFDPFYDGTF